MQFEKTLIVAVAGVGIAFVSYWLFTGNGHAELSGFLLLLVAVICIAYLIVIGDL